MGIQRAFRVQRPDIIQVRGIEAAEFGDRKIIERRCDGEHRAAVALHRLRHLPVAPIGRQGRRRFVDAVDIEAVRLVKRREVSE